MGAAIFQYMTKHMKSCSHQVYAAFLAAFAVSLPLGATVFTWDDEAGNGILFNSPGYSNWDPDLTASDLGSGSNNDYVISNTTRDTFYVTDSSNENNWLGSISFAGTLPNLITISANANATSGQRYLRFYNAGATIFSLADNFTGTVRVVSSTGYLGVGLNYTGMGTIHIGNSSATLDLSGAVNNTSGIGGVYGTGGIIKTGAGTLNLSSTDSQGNTFSGGLWIYEGTVIIQSMIRLGAAQSSFKEDAVVLNGGTLRLVSGPSGAATTSGVNRGFLVGHNVGTIEVTGSITRTINSAVGDVENEAGVLRKIGTGTLGLVTSNTFSGGLEILEGRVRADGMDRLGSGAVTIDGGTLELAYLEDSVKSSSSGQNFRVGENMGTIETADVRDTWIVNGSVSDVVGQEGVLRKTGAGTLVLNASTTHTGGTLLNAGVLRLGNSTLSSGLFATAGAGTLQGSGIIEGFSVIGAGVTIDARHVNATGELTANLVGTLTFAGDLDISAAVAGNTPIFLFDLGFDSDLIEVTNDGAFAFGDNLLGLQHFAFTIGDGFGEGVYTLISVGSSDSVVGSFSSNTESVIGGYNVTLAFNAEGNAIQLVVGSAIPEPATWAAILGGSVLGLALWRRQTRI